MSIETQPIGSTSTPGIILPSRSPSITLHRRVSLSEEANASTSKRDSLEGTRSYYGLSPNTPQLTRNLSSSSRRSNNDRPSSRSSSPSRSINTSISNHNPTSPTSPTQRTAPLPTPRAFLSPRKPVAALRLEQREKDKFKRQSGSTNVVSVYDTPAKIPPERNSSDVATSIGHTSFTSREITTDKISHSGPSEAHGHYTKGSVHSWEEDRTGSPKRSNTITTHTSRRETLPEVSTDHLINGTLPRSEKHPSQPGQRSGRTSEHLMSSHEAIDPSTTRKRKRKYEGFAKSGSTFFFNGKLMTGGDNPLSMILSMIVLFGLSGVWVGTTGVWFWVHGSEYGLVTGGGIGIMVVFIYLFGLSVGSMLAAAFRDPGVIPRNLDLKPPYSQTSSEYWDAVPREILIGSSTVTVKYCETCKIYRPPRSSHCRLCGNCVDGIDHHCAYIHQCVGKRNYLTFLTFVITAGIATIYIVVFSAIHFALLCSHNKIYFKDALANSPGAAVSFALGICVLPPMLFLSWYHVRLLIYNLTTIEQIRASASKSLLKATSRPDNPFAEKSRIRNILVASLGRPQFPSWVDAAGWQVEDKRSVNPGVYRRP